MGQLDREIIIYIIFVQAPLLYCATASFLLTVATPIKFAIFLDVRTIPQAQEGYKPCLLYTSVFGTANTFAENFNWESLGNAVGNGINGALGGLEMCIRDRQRAVETAVEEKLKGGKPPKKAPGGDAQKALEEQVYNIMMGNN